VLLSHCIQTLRDVIVVAWLSTVQKQIRGVTSEANGHSVTYSRASYLIEILGTLTRYVILVMKMGRSGHARERTEIPKKKFGHKP